MARGPLADYPRRLPGSARAGDLYASAAPAIARLWEGFAEGLLAQGDGEPARVQAQVDTQADNLGLAFRLTGDVQERSWPLGAMPIILDAEEWRGIEAGLIQRARLLEAVLADIHGPQNLVRDGHLPAQAIAGSRDFEPRMVGQRPPGHRYLYVLAVDLARGPTGEWRVLSDRARIPLGIGYALENRLALSRGTGSLLAGIGARRLSDFFEAIRAGIAANCQRTDPRIGLLSPGRFNQAYPEQALLARHLGFALVEGRDLVVREGKLYVRTIAGLKRIDALWRWINARDIDPLAFDVRSRIGVPDLHSTWERADGGERGLVVANWPGVGVIESRAMQAFLPRLAEVLLGEGLALPNVATWWCGQEAERAHVIDNLDSLVIGPSFRGGVEGLGGSDGSGSDGGGQARRGASLSPSERQDLLAALARRPMDFSGQEVVRLSTTPCLTPSGFEPRAFTLRTFLTRDGDGRWRVMPGGFGRLSNQGELRTSLMGAGDISADVCVVEAGSRERSVAPGAPSVPPVRRAEGLLPSQAADNLFWLGRYCERAQLTASLVRDLLSATATERRDAPADSAVPQLAGLLARLGAAAPLPLPAGPGVTPGMTIDAGQAADLARAALTGDQRGALPQLIDRTRELGRQLRDRLSPDSWRVLSRPLRLVETRGGEVGGGEELTAIPDRIIERFAALHQLLADHMSRAPAWRFLDAGRALERASLVVQASLALADEACGPDQLTALLGLFDIEYLYASRYLTSPFRVPVLDLVLLDPVQPRSLAYQLEALRAHLEALPVLGEDGMPEPPLRQVRRLLARLATLEPETIDRATLDTLFAEIGSLSDAIARRFFHQADLPGGGPGGLLPA